MFAPLLAVSLFLPTFQQPSDAQIAAWIAADLAAGGGPRVAAEQRLAEAGLVDDLALAREVGGRLAGAGACNVIVGVSGGEVILDGRVRDEAQRARVLDLAAGVEGVRGVDSRLLLPGEEPAPAAPAEPAEAQAAPVPAAPASAEPVDFLAPDGLAGREIAVSVTNGVATLSGRVSSAAAGRWAAAAAARVPGVRTVRNELTARPPSARDDRRLALLVLREIEGDVLVQTVAPAVDVDARDGVVRLTGKVRDEAQREQAGRVAAGLEAVFAVDNRLVVDEALVLAPTHRNRGFRTWRDR